MESELNRRSSMALVRSLFAGSSASRRKVSTIDGRQQPTSPNDVVSDFCTTRKRQATKKDIRFMVYTESSYRLLFDTKSVIPISNDMPEGGRLSKCGKYQLLRHELDAAGIAQLIFGSMSLPAKSDALKVHRLNSAIMLTRVFPMAKPTGIQRFQKMMVDSLSSDSEPNYWSIRSTDTMYSSSLSPKVNRSSLSCPDPPEMFSRLRQESLQSGGLSPDSTEDMQMFSPRRLSRSRRLNMSRKGSICEEGLQHSYSRSRLSSCCSNYTDSDNVKQIGIAVVLPEELRDFAFTHIPVIEDEILKLEAQVIKAMLSKTLFLSLIYEGWNTFCDFFCLLYNAPRIAVPVWQGLSSSAAQDTTARKFCSTLAELVATSDTKSSKYFVSTTLSCVLMNHVSWVASVNSPTTCSNANDLLIGKNLPDKDLKPPYNCLLAQYLEICGSIGVGNRYAKTVIVGEDIAFATKLIYALSYFIRCSSVSYDDSTVKSVVKTEPLAVTEPLSVNVDFPMGAVPHFSILESADESITQFERRVVRFEDEEVPDNRVRLSYNNVEVIENDGSNLLAAESGISTAVENARPTENLNLGMSLLAGVCPSFSEHFVLSGIDKSKVNMPEVYSSIIDHVRQSEEPKFGLLTPRTPSPNSSEAGDSGASATDVPHVASVTPGECVPQSHTSIFIVADTSEHTVKVVASEGGNVTCSAITSPSEVVVSMLEQFVDLYKLGCATAFLISFLEDNLSSILSKSVSLVELLYDEKRQSELCPFGENLDMSTASRVIGCDCSDLRMVVNVAAVYHPRILSALK
ncbi:hypothetical protein QR680_003291 [Steinernema hermaphroditum]|uniref:UDENN FNIP1/2-type domain-containing protein n=1 Tax=Steinernema hermaphroditum TaxID=289476 RepID=A0AA39LJT5_9BILA|nr:hypothetical protein QR680_003291 [Steinernema hermaphroditum]